jgi:multisubunit Na+/H+ antiporter MnhB subunit
VIANRSLVVQDGIRLASPLAIIVATALFFAGHNQPGGGFAGGLVLGAVVALRSVTGLSVPQHPIRMMAIGGVIIGCVALAPLVIGDVALDQYIWEAQLPVLGKAKTGTALIFDVGVVLIVLGLILAMLDALAAPGDPDIEPPNNRSEAAR